MIIFLYVTTINYLGENLLQRTLVIIVALLFFSPITNLGFTNNIKTKSELNHKWTWLFYDDVDYEPAIDPFDEFAEEISSNNNFDIIVLQDTLNDTGKIWEIGNEHEKKLMQTLDEIDMGDFNTLKNFINFGKEQYPADRYILTIFDHGAGWAGACLDETNDGWLTMDEMQRALLDSGGMDILCFIACQMTSVESAYELRHCTDIYIGSQETTGYSFWRNTSSKICRIINENPEISNEDLGMMIIDSIKQENDENNYPGLLRYINEIRALPL
jgi:hypothetical protein